MATVTVHRKEECKPGKIRLLGSTGSPYARMARIALMEKGLQHEWVEVASPAISLENGRMNVIWTRNDAWNIEMLNPLGKIPVLLHKGKVWHDSRVICSYIDSLMPAPALYGLVDMRGAPDGPMLFSLRVEACCQGICDAISYVKGVNSRNGEHDPTPLSVETQSTIHAALQVIEQWYEQSGALGRNDRVTMADIALCAVLDYLELRMPAIKWQRDFKVLDIRYTSLATREAFSSTKFSMPCG